MGILELAWILDFIVAYVHERINGTCTHAYCMGHAKRPKTFRVTIGRTSVMKTSESVK
jgi:hypothetical protein